MAMEKYGVQRDLVERFMEEGDSEQEAMEKVASGKRPVPKKERRGSRDTQNG